jgi:drug/metabolite transporter (DMT)-like permease
VLGAVFIGEPIRTAQIAGGVVIVGGVALTRVRSTDVSGWVRGLLPD